MPIDSAITCSILIVRNPLAHRRRAPSHTHYESGTKRLDPRMISDLFAGRFRLPFAVASLVIMCGTPAALRGYQGERPYIVKRYDTLWDLSRRFLDDPYNWKLIWRENSHIGNPDLIYPGDPLTMPGRFGEKSASVHTVKTAKADFAEAVNGFPDAEEFAATSSLFATVADKADVNPANANYASAEKGRYSAKHLARVGFLWTKEDAKGLVAPGVAFIDEKKTKTFQLFERLPIVMIDTHRFSVNDTVDIFESLTYLRYRREVVNLVKRVGRARVESVDGDRVLATLFEAWDVVRGKCRIAPVERFSSRTVERIVQPRTSLSGTVFTRIEGSEIPQLHQTFIIDRGSRDGVRLGDIFEVRSARVERADPSLLGCVLHVGRQSSTLSIMRLYASRLEPGDTATLAKRIVFRED
ncbi:MAG: LysM peptidoglycan-binding domain-containing protein [Chitinivibrionales bacterium]|nr:LysM peptidoglycan-binding domain-containing protein [Chitinivibrionales bacterium]MBD3358287.1 LysM peptidoglycan-binding domain-containing protein [Chitinivibrionales bacterium]